MPRMIDQNVAAVRQFNRFYTQRLGLLHDGGLYAPFSLTAARVLYELAHRPDCTASQLASDLGLDHGYLSRILRGFEQDNFIDRVRAAHDGRQALLSLTRKGQQQFARLDQRARTHVTGLLERIPLAAQRRLVAAMDTIEATICPCEASNAGYLLRPPRAGEMGWVVARHGAIYAEEYGWGPRFEALVADIVAQFARKHDRRRECCFIAELAGEPVGSAFVMRSSEKVAKLRLLIVEPKARGLGIGRQLVEQSLEFAGRAGHESMTLWTQKILTSARKIYAQTGFKLVGSRRHRTWGVNMIGETWQRRL
jgi:DNA-binding MarR family transcriptional regulator/GNAT superfamily N-acetyltransferase